MDNAPSTPSAVRARWTAVLGLLAACLAAGFFMVVPPVFVLQRVWVIWPIGWMHTWRWGLLAGVLGLAFWSYRQARRAAGCEAQSPAWRRWIGVVTPLALLPLGAVISLLADLLPPLAVSNGLFFFPVLIVSMVVYRAVEAIPSAWGGNRAVRRSVAGILAGATLFFAGVGYYVSTTTGEHVGDEGHYLIQAESLFKDHDLDIRNNFAPEGTDLSELSLLTIHIAPTARDGHWYSWHPYGLSILLAPFWPAGMPVRQAVLGLISAAGLAGLLLICLRCGASLRASLLAVLLLAGSVFWTVYSVRSLPEVLGASLLIWVFWAIAAQRDKPWTSLLVAAACCVYLPFAHMRFLPLALMGLGLYGLAGLRGAEPWRHKIPRLAVFTLLCLAGGAIYARLQFGMFQGGDSYTVGGVFFNFPLGAWAVVSDARGVASVLPGFLWMAAAWMIWTVADRGNRWFALATGVTFLACLLTSASNTFYVGGSCVPGRFTLVVVPLLIPACACLLDRVSPAARGWFVFLGVISVAVLVVLLVRLPSIGRDFVLPVHAISGHPLLAALLRPHATFSYDAGWTCWVTSVYVLSGIGLTLVILLTPAGRTVRVGLAVAGVAATAVLAHLALATQSPTTYQAGLVAAELFKLDLDRATVIRRDATRAAPLFDVSRYVFRDVRNPQRLPSVTTRDLGERCVDQTLSQPRIEVNDWNGRGFRWSTLTAPIAPSRGRKLIHIGGRVEGTAVPVFAAREGSRTLFEGPLPVKDGKVASDLDVAFRGRFGHLYILVRLENGDGVFHLDELYWSPYGERLLQMANLLLPGDRIRTGAE